MFSELGVKLFCALLVFWSMAFCSIIRSRGRVFAVVKMLVIGLERNAPMANLKPELWIVSIILSEDCLTSERRKAPYSNLDRIRDLYICFRDVPFAPHEVCARSLMMFNLIRVAFLISFKWACHVLLLSKVIPRIFIVLEYGMGVLFKLKSSFLCFLSLVKRVQRDFRAEKMKPVLEDHWVNELIVFCNAGWMEFRFFPLQRIFKSSAKRVD